jgi:hypothetical protein
MLVAMKERFDRDPSEPFLIFEDGTGRQVDFDLRGSAEQVLARAAPPTTDAPRAGPGRPKLGVVSREVSLLPRQWEWLELQPNGISAALRRLVDEARKRDPEGDRKRLAIEATFRFMNAMAGNRENFEEATRALFAKDETLFAELIEGWPADIRNHVARLLEGVGLLPPTSQDSSPSALRASGSDQ